MSFSLRSFSSLVQTAIVTAQAQCGRTMTLSVGTPGRALIESVAALGLWLQYLLLILLCRTRLATSVGSDCDSFVGDFGMTRLPGVCARGRVTMSCFSYSDISAVIRPGVLVRTVAAVTFQVVVDVDHENWSAKTGGYVRPAGQARITVPVEALTAGISGNVAKGAISLMATSVAGIDVVTNTSALSSGADQETDAQLRERFPLWLSAKASASRAAIKGAVSETQTALDYVVLDGTMADGSARAGYFTVIVDDGSESVPDVVMQRVYAAVEARKALGVGFGVQRATILTVLVSMEVRLSAGSDIEAARTVLIRAIADDISAAHVGAGYPVSRLSYVAYVTSNTGVLSVTRVRLNGAQDDIPAQTGRALRAGTISIEIVQEG